MRALFPVVPAASARKDRPDDASTVRRILIAVDGRPASTNALRWAHLQLITSRDEVVVVTAYTYPPYASEYPDISADLEHTAACARYVAERAIRSVFGDAEPGRDVTHIVELGTIDQLVERHAATTAFIVIGSRSRRRLRERLRSSATNRITGRAMCPVVSVPVDVPTAPAAAPSTSPLDGRG